MPMALPCLGRFVSSWDLMETRKDSSSTLHITCLAHIRGEKSQQCKTNIYQRWTTGCVYMLTASPEFQTTFVWTPHPPQRGTMVKWETTTAVSYCVKSNRVELRVCSMGLLKPRQRASGLSCLWGRTCQKAHGWWVPAVPVIVLWLVGGLFCQRNSGNCYDSSDDCVSKTKRK